MKEETQATAINDADAQPSIEFKRLRYKCVTHGDIGNGQVSVEIRRVDSDEVAIQARYCGRCLVETLDRLIGRVSEMR